MTECSSARTYRCALTLAALGAGFLVAGASAQVATSTEQSVKAFASSPRTTIATKAAAAGRVWRADLIDRAGVAPLSNEPGVRGACSGVDCPPRAQNAFRSELFPDAPIRVADDFSLQSTAAPTSVCFWGLYADNVPNVTESFTINILDDAGGFPGNVIFTQTVSTGAGLTRTATGAVILDTFDEFQYEVDLAGVPVLQAGECHWIEILHDGSNPAGWFWSVTTNADGRYHTITDLAAPYSNFNELQNPAGQNPAWCLDVARDFNSSCALATPDVVCQQGELDDSCQFSDMTTGGIFSDDAPFDGEGSFVAADDFQVPAGPAQTVTELCWGGFYAGAGTQPDLDFFLVEFYEDANGAPGEIIASLFEGGDFTVNRGWSGEFQGIFYYSATLPAGAVTLPGGECYWVSIRNAAVNSQWVWLTSLEGNGVAAVDTVSAAGVPAGWTVGDREDATDMFFCLGFDMVPFGGCAFNPTLPPNDQCFTATSPEFSVPVDGATLTGSTVGASASSAFDGVEPCGVVVLAPTPDIWFSVANTAAVARDITVSTNFAGTNFDTMLAVYCQGAGFGACGVEALCVDGNDDGPGSTIGQSAVTFTAAPSTTYLIRVLGFGGDQGSVEIGATSAPASGDAVGCEACEITQPAMATVETELCDDSGASESNFDCVLPLQTVSVPGAWFGSVWANGGTRDIDSFLFTLTEPTDVVITIRNQMPLWMTMWTDGDTCSPDAANVFGGFFLFATSCNGDNFFTVSLPAGTFQIQIAPGGTSLNGDDSFEGLPCSTFNTVQINLDVAAQGQCCLPSGDCIQVSEAICDVNDGVYGGDGTVCSGPTCDADVCPCEFDSVAGVDVFDLLAYLDLWFANAAGADIDGVAGVDVFDLLAFLDCWFPASAGNPCP